MFLCRKLYLFYSCGAHARRDWRKHNRDAPSAAQFPYAKRRRPDVEQSGIARIRYTVRATVIAEAYVRGGYGRRLRFRSCRTRVLSANRPPRHAVRQKSLSLSFSLTDFHQELFVKLINLKQVFISCYSSVAGALPAALVACNTPWYLERSYLLAEDYIACLLFLLPFLTCFSAQSRNC